MSEADFTQIKEYLNERFTSLEKSVAAEIAHLSEKIDAALGPVSRDIERLRGDADDLYKMDRTQATEIAELRSEIARLDQAQKEKQRLTTALLAILGAIFAAVSLWLGFRG